jgi:hypothetical protein
VSDGRPKAAAQIYKHGRLKTGKELEQERIRNLSFDEGNYAKWPNGDWCEVSELEEYLTWHSDDYEIVIEVNE